MSLLLWSHNLIVLAIVMMALVAFALQTLLVVVAERGRKQDLVRKRPPNRQEFNLAIIVPYTNPLQLGDLQHLLRALDAQSYAKSRLRVLLGCTNQTIEDVHDGRLTGVPIEAHLYPNLHPTEEADADSVRAWLTERALATGHNDLLVMLLPSDVVKPDFCTQVAAMAYQAEVFQGYVATREADTILEKQQALARRLFNRIELAGRYHLGLTCRLQSSGWAIQPNLLERLPYHGTPADYTYRLLLMDQRVTWAPSVSVFQRLGYGHHIRLFEVVQHAVMTVFGRGLMLVNLTVPLLTEAFARPKLSLALEWSALLRLPALAVGFVLAMFAAADVLGGSQLGPLWCAFLLGMVCVHVLALGVARCRLSDIAHSLFWTPILAVAGVALMPLMLVNLTVKQGLSATQQWQRSRKPAFAHARVTRLNEGIPAVKSILDGPTTQQDVLDFLTGANPQAPTESTTPSHSPGTDGLLRQLEADLSMQEAPRNTPQVTEKVVPISNGKQQVDALLQVHTSYKDDQPRYRMTLAYRTVSFSTQRYRILDQAFYELESKVMSKGLTIVTCGSCGYFYHPTADVSDKLVSNGVCLFGKQGREVDLATDAVTVISDACHYHTPLEERETIVREWQTSLTFKQRVI